MKERMEQLKSNYSEKLRKIGLIFLLLDYIFIAYILYRINAINYVFTENIRGIRPTLHILYYGIPILFYQEILLLYLIRKISTEDFKQKALILKGTVMNSIKATILPIVFATLFSFLFLERLQEYVPRVDVDLQPYAIHSYYLTFVIMIIYFLIRTLFAFDYYQSLYLNNKTDYRYFYCLLLFFIFTIAIFWLPHKIFLR